jgi:acyl-CoA thioesterase-1
VPVLKSLLVIAAGVVLGCAGRGNPLPGAAAGSATGDSSGPAADLAQRPAVAFLGTSLTAGLGLDPAQAYPALIQQKLDSAGLPFRVINAGESGSTSAGGLRRLDWLLQQPVRILVIELGANDALRGQDLEATRRNLQAIVDRARAAYPDIEIVIAGMQAPPNLGEEYTRRFRDLFPELARRNRAELIPFLLEGVAAVPRLNQADGIHPTAEGQRLVAENVWRVLRPIAVRVAERARRASP